MMQTNEQKCFCEPCVSVVTIKDAIQKNDALYCSEACSNGHVDGNVCANDTCGCTTKH